MSSTPHGAWDDGGARPGDDLFTASIPAAPAGPPPWRVGSTFWVFFLGGALAGGVIAWLNGQRLGLDHRRQRLVLVWSAAALVATLVAAVVLASDESGSPARLAGRVAAVVLGYLAVARLQQPAERASELRGVEPASLWGPGLAAVLGLGLVQAVLTAAVVGIS